MNLRTLSIRTRLYLLLATPILALILLASATLLISATADRTFERVFADRILPLRQLKQIADAYAVSIVDAANKTTAGVIEPAVAAAGVREARAEAARVWDRYLATELTEQEAALTREAARQFEAARDEIDLLLTALGGPDAQQATSARIAALYRAIDPLSESLSALIDLQIEVAEAEKQALAVRGD